jgi:superfamily I DNA/RNA helicase
MLLLPSLRELSREQLAIHNLPLNGSYLVVGPPGTGKTIMAIYRAEMYKRAGKQSLFLVHNRPLAQYLQQATSQRGLECTTRTFHSWFFWWYCTRMGRRPPTLAKWKYDWHTILMQVNTKKNLDRYDHVIVDEGQDFPREFYFLVRAISHNLTVFADENQRLFDDNSTISDIKVHLGVKEAFSLTRNYRNTLPIAKLSQHFYAGLQTGLPDLPLRNGPKPYIGRFSDATSQIRRIANMSANYTESSIGVFVDSRDLDEMESLMARHMTACYQVYRWNAEPLDFASKDVKLLTYQTAKGLEFDIVFLPVLERRTISPQTIDEKMRFYVLTSRARQRLFLFYSGESRPPLLKDIPRDLVQVIGR